MSEPTPETDETQSGATDSEFQPILSNEEFEKLAKNRIGRAVAKATAKFSDYNDLQAKAKRLADLEAANLSEGERQAERIRTLETELETERHNNVRRDVAVAKGVPPDRISGTTREELEQSADDLLAFIAERATPPPKQVKPASGLKSGASNTDARMDKKEQAAAMLRQWRAGTQV